MIVRAMELAEKELGLLDFKTPEDYLKLDDFTVWTKLLESKASKKMMKKLTIFLIVKIL